MLSLLPTVSNITRIKCWRSTYSNMLAWLRVEVSVLNVRWWMKVWRSSLPFSSVRGPGAVTDVRPSEQKASQDRDKPGCNVPLSTSAKCLRCHHRYNTSVVIATDKLFVYHTLFMTAWTIGELCTLHSLFSPLGCMQHVCWHLCFIPAPFSLHVWATYLYIFKMVSFQVLLSPQTFFRNSSQGPIFYSHSTRLDESHTVLLY